MVSKKVHVHNFSDSIFQKSDEVCKRILKYECSVTFKHNNIEGNAKSVVSVLSVCTKVGDEIEIICEGRDEKLALKAVVDMFENGI